VFAVCFIGTSSLAYAALEFDSVKMEKLEALQASILEEEKGADVGKLEGDLVKGKEGRMEDALPSSPYITRVQDDQLATSSQVYREQLKITSREQKTLLDRFLLQLTTDVAYDSNVFKDSNNEKSDYYYGVGPRIHIDGTNLYKGLGFDLRYSGQWIQYLSLARLNRFDHNLSLAIPGKGQKFRFGKKLTVELTLGLGVTSDNEISSIDQGSFTPRINPEFGLYAEYPFNSRLSTDFKYGFSYRRQDNTSKTSSGEESSRDGKRTFIKNDFRQRLKYHITPKTNIFVGAGYGWTSSSASGEEDSSTDKNFDSNYVRLSAGVDGKLTAKSVVNLDAGWEVREIDSRGNENQFNIRAAYLWKFARKWSSRFVLVRDFEAAGSSDVGLFSTWLVRAGVSYRPASKWRWSLVGQRRSSNFERDRTSKGVTTARDFTEREYSVETGLHYKMNRWLRMKLGYEFEFQTSDEDRGDFDRHRATFRVVVG